MDRAVIVTGGFGSLGTAIAAAFAEAGDRVARIDFASASHTQLAGAVDIGGVDLTNPAATAQAVMTVRKAIGDPDILVNVAGGFAWETLTDGNLATWARMHEMNLLTTVNMTMTVLPLINKSAAGRVINVGAGAAVKAGKGFAPYAASKAGVHKVTEALADELEATAVTVNAILPSIIDTPANRADMPDADFSTWVRPEAIADVILFLASEAGRSINGALIPVTRGG